MQYSELYQFCNTPLQRERLRQIEEHGNPTAAATAVKGHDGTYRRLLRDLKARAALAGVSESNLNPQIPEGFQVKGTSTLYDTEGNAKLQWVKTSQDQERQLEAMQAMVDALKEDIPKEKPVRSPKTTDANLANQYTITDYHLGCLAWGEETGADWNLKIAEDLLVKWFQKAISIAPDAHTAYLLDLGDTEHYDSILAVTPTSGNVLDADSRFQKVIRVMIRVIRRVVSMLLEKHAKVVLIKAEGNHNISTSIAAREWLTALYDDEPRVEVDNTARPYHCHQFGQNMLCATHGHKKKFNELPLMFAAMFPKEWGSTKHRYCETGHYHHHKEQEHSGMIVTQHQTLAAPDAHSARGGWLSQRSALVKTYHKEHGLCGYLRITPDML
jgi:hypothetical protein